VQGQARRSRSCWPLCIEPVVLQAAVEHDLERTQEGGDQHGSPHTRSMFSGIRRLNIDGVVMKSRGSNCGAVKGDGNRAWKYPPMLHRGTRPCRLSSSLPPCPVNPPRNSSDKLA
jgi:hypothetical protein